MRTVLRIPFPTLPRRVLLGVVVLLSANLSLAFSHLAPQVKWPARTVATAVPRRRVVLARSRRVTVAPPKALAARTAVPAPARTMEETRMLTLEHGAFPGRRAPDALVYVPAGIDPAQPLNVVVFIHGWNGCAASVSADVPTECHPDGTRRGPLALVSQVRTSGAAAVLVVPQMGLEARSSDPGRFREPGFFRAFLAEVLSQMEPTLGRHRVEDLGRVVLASHSGGYVTLLQVLSHGDVPVDEIALFDSLYDGSDRVLAWVADHADRFDPASARPVRLVSVYRGGATEASTEELGRGAVEVLRREGHPEWVLRRRTEGTVTAAEAHAPVVLARVPGNHQQAVRWNLATVLAGAGMPVVAAR